MEHDLVTPESTFDAVKKAVSEKKDRFTPHDISVDLKVGCKVMVGIREVIQCLNTLEESGHIKQIEKDKMLYCLTQPNLFTKT